MRVRSTKISKLRNTSKVPIPKLWGRFSLTWIRTTNTTYNVVPDSVIVGFDMRLIPEENVDDAISELKAYFEMTKYRLGIHDVNMEIIRAFPGYMTDENDPFVQHALRALIKATGREIPIIGMLGGNDGGWFRNYGIPVVSFGVWDEHSNIHGSNESVSLARIEDLKKFVINLVCD